MRETDAERQAKVDAAVESLLTDSASFVTGKEALRRLSGLIGMAENTLRLNEVVDDAWRPEEAHRFEDDLESERIAELEQGALLEEEEQALWESEVDTMMSAAEVVWVYRLQSSAGPCVWGVFVTDGMEQGSGEIDGAGPFFSATEVAAYTAARARNWFGWWCVRLAEDGETEALEEEIERGVGTPQDAFWREIGDVPPRL